MTGSGRPKVRAHQNGTAPVAGRSVEKRQGREYKALNSEGGKECADECKKHWALGHNEGKTSAGGWEAVLLGRFWRGEENA